MHESMRAFIVSVAVAMSALCCNEPEVGCSDASTDGSEATAQPSAVTLPQSIPRKPSPPSPSLNELSRIELRDRSRVIVEEHCGSCHLPWFDTSHERALRVFDLSEVEWAAPMDEAQLRDVAFRLSEGLAPAVGNGAGGDGHGADGDLVPMNVPAADLALYRRYVDVELAYRYGGGPP